MQLSLGQAAAEAGVSKSTLSRAIKTGRLSATRTPEGGYIIDPAELFRVYEPKPATPPSNGIVAHHATHGAPDATPVLKAENEGLRAQLELLRDQLDDVKQQRDSFLRLIEGQHRVLAAPRRRWWARLKG